MSGVTRFSIPDIHQRRARRVVWAARAAWGGRSRIPWLPSLPSRFRVRRRRTDNAPTTRGNHIRVAHCECLLQKGIIMAEIATAALPAVVLVHGGFVDGSGWEGTYKILKKDGYNVSIVQNP